jgi:hypothetical protein
MTVRRQILGLTVVAIFFAAVAHNLAQTLPPLGHAKDFNADFYFKEPHGDKIQARMSGAEALPVTGGLLDVKKFQLEMFKTNGAPLMTAASPFCTFAPMESEVHSAQHLIMRSGDGAFQVEADGFSIVCKEEAMSLMLSNNVRTVIDSEILKPLNP